MPVISRYFLVLAAVVVTAGPCVQPCWGQTGGRLGQFAARGGLFALLGRSSVQEKLALSQKQVADIGELRGSARPEAEEFEPLFEKLGQAADDAARDAVRAEMRALRNRYRANAEAKLAEILSESQQKTLVELAIAEAGAGALHSRFVRMRLNVTDVQAGELSQLFQERRRAAGGLTRGDDEARAAFTRQWNAKLVAVLTPEQRSQWESLAPAEAATNNVVSNESDGGTAANATNTRDADSDSEQSVSSFGAEELSGGERAAEPSTISFNFHQAPWSEVLRQFADYANLTLDLNDVPPGTFSYRDDREFTATEALDVLNGYLLRKGYILVRRDRFLICLNIDNGIPPNLVPNITVAELAKRGKNELLSVMFPITGVPATDVAREVELLLGPQGKVVPLSTSNSLVVTDIGSNLRRIKRLLATVSEASLGDMVFQSYPLTYLDPYEAERIVKGQLGLEVGTRSVSSAYENWRRDRDDDDRDRERRREAARAAAEDKAEVMADLRTNSLLVTATAEEHRIVKDVLKATDVAVTNDGYRSPRSTEPYLEVYTLYNSEPQEVVKTLDVLMPGVVVNEDGRNEKIHVHAPAAVQKEVAQLIRKLDGEKSRGDMAVTVIPLSKLDPYAAATTIQSLFLMEDEEDMPIIEADSYGRRLLVRGTQPQVEQVKTLLAQMGEDGTGRRAYATGPVRTIPLGGRDPEELVPLLRRLWETSSDVPIRVVPSSPGMIIEKVPLRPSEAVGEAVSAVGDESSIAPTANFMVTDPVPVADPLFPTQEGAKRPPVVAPIPAGRQAGGGGVAALRAATANGPVVMTVRGGNLVLSSENEAALDQLQELLVRLGEVIPPRTKWSVFYLRIADATEAAMLLEQIFPTSSVTTATLDSGFFGSLTRGMSSLGGGLMDAAGLGSMGVNTMELRIIPDIRSNSLFVTGPPNKVAQVEQVLKVLDASELPDSLRDRLPRMIEVKYADVEEVAEIVRDVYKDYLQPARGAAGGGNPLAFLMGGGRDRDEDDPQGRIRLTVGVDTGTSTLIVSASQELFQQIEDLVTRLDQKKLEAKPTVRVVTLENADVEVISSTLGALIPNVRTSSTSDYRGRGDDSNGPDAGGDNDSDADRDNDRGRARDEARERLRRYIEMQSRRGRGDRDRGRGRD